MKDNLKDDGGPAFPNVVWEHALQAAVQQGGLTIRDWFAGQALRALIAKIPLQDAEGEFGQRSSAERNAKIQRDVSDSAYYYADAMLEARKP